MNERQNERAAEGKSGSLIKLWNRGTLDERHFESFGHFLSSIFQCSRMNEGQNNRLAPLSNLWESLREREREI